MTRVLIIPGLHGSGPEHWQTHWQEHIPGAARVEQADWDAPKLAAWLAALDAHVQSSQEETVLVAHSLGCALVAHWAARSSRPAHVVGALLVAPPDVETAVHMLPEVSDFVPLPRTQLGMPCAVIASENDPYCPLEQARSFARAWDARFVCVGALGHINAESRLSGFERGRTVLAELLEERGFRLDDRLRADAISLGESAFNKLLLMNDRRYPWLLLVPKREGASEWFLLKEAERLRLGEESCLVSRALSECFSAHKINVGALGNVVRQLHVHHVARFVGDPAWPGPVWGHSPREAYTGDELERVRLLLARSVLRELFAL